MQARRYALLPLLLAISAAAPALAGPRFAGAPVATASVGIRIRVVAPLPAVEHAVDLPIAAAERREGVEPGDTVHRLVTREYRLQSEGASR